MTTPEASQLVVQSLAVGQSGQTLILDMGQPVKILDLAEQLIQLAGLTPDVDIPIQITGLRPGEKLHESLVNSHEKTISTEHPKIMAVSSQLPPREAFSTAIAMLSEAATSNLPPEKLWFVAQDCVRALESLTPVTDCS
jgi:FlaA1/EpsC-like NDP-sugar epimerase